MPQDTQQPTEHKESFVEKIFDHHKHGNEGHAAKDEPQGGEGRLRSDLEKDKAGLKQYLKEDEQLEEEGQTYGGLM
ncbi:uncharacterized protein PFLUO_LOCUS4756 [Penicillium psychrofluorescens]|uniref:uncharacterized protein n=1 Tax=Penicillium psychrofluorescens TaxID=3158075 RepID=UPI003CCE04BD